MLRRVALVKAHVPAPHAQALEYTINSADVVAPGYEDGCGLCPHRILFDARD